LVGEDSTGTVIGAGTRGTTDGFIIKIFNGTGEAGIAINIGKEKESGTSTNINPLHHNRNRNGDKKDNMSIHGSPRSRNTNNGKRSNKSNAKFINLKINSKDNPRFRNLKVNNQDRNRSTLRLTENLREGTPDIESRMTRGLETVPFSKDL
jgi:hypothetical protein